MDIKAMAKSKRSHTKHHQPRKPHHPKPIPSSSCNNPADPKAGKNEVKPKKKEDPQISLPSNWDRYENDNGEEEEIPIYSDDEQGGFTASSKVKRAVDGVKPKSKGADFAYLIAQAKESQTSYSPSFDDALPDFYQGFGPMLAVQGEGIRAQDRDYDFLLKDEATTSQEAPFLSLDLKVLAEELAKADVAKRLFIEPDILPPELRGQDANEADNQVPLHSSERQELRAETFGDLYSIYLAEEKMAQKQDGADKEGMMSSCNVTSSSSTVPPSAADVTLSKLVNIVISDAEEMPRVSHITEQGTKSDLGDVVLNTSIVTEQDRKSELEDLESIDANKILQFNRVPEQDTGPSSRIQADAAEAELDMLLDSFSDTKLSDSPATRPKIASSIGQRTSVSYLKGDSANYGAPSQQALRPSTPAFPIASRFDDELDDLLQGTSKPFESTEAKVSSPYHAPKEASLQHSLPAFPIASSLDDELDSLLEETSKTNNRDSPFTSSEVNVASLDLPSSSSSSSSHPSSKSKLLDDFDSWLGTI